MVGCWSFQTPCLCYNDRVPGLSRPAFSPPRSHPIESSPTPAQGRVYWTHIGVEFHPSSQLLYVVPGSPKVSQCQLRRLLLGLQGAAYDDNVFPFELRSILKIFVLIYAEFLCLMLLELEMQTNF